MSIQTEIITIGDEILIGQTVDTNSAWLGEKLDMLGFHVAQITSIQDQPGHIVRALDQALQGSDLIIITGGLGPTLDDRTKNTLADYFNTKLVYNEVVMSNIRQILGSRNVPLNEMNQDQALVPEACEILKNAIGTAPGMLFRKGSKVVVSLPGVPFEMKSISENEMFPWLIKNFNAERSIFRMVMTSGYPESVLATKMAGWESQLPSHFSLAYLPSPGMVKLRITAEGKSEFELDQELDRQIELLRQAIPEAIYSFHNRTMAEVVGMLLIEINSTLASAESCTGGRVANMITSIAGSSGYYQGSILAYSYEAKRELLEVEQKDLNRYGAVSKEVVGQMVQAVRRKLHVDYAVATSGIAGPGGGTDDKPVGMVWIAVASKNKVVAKLYQFGDHRGRNIERSSMATLNMLRKLILEEHAQKLNDKLSIF